MRCWDHFVKNCPKLDLLVLMGDLIDGKNYKSSGVGAFSTDLGEQADMAARVLEPLAAKAKKTIRLWGTPYHESFDNVLAIVDKALGVSTVQQVIDVDMGRGNVLNIAHHPAGGAALYQGTVADREALWSAIAAQDNKVPKARWLVRAHKHNFFHIETANRDMLITPCWQLATAYAVKQNYFRFQPDIGAVLMVKDSQADSGYRFLPRLYPNPIPEVVGYSQL